MAGGELTVSWADGHESTYPFDWLRRRCPCTACRSAVQRAVAEGVAGDARSAQVTVVRLSFVGNYGVQIAWSDAHDSGIYPFEWLRHRCPRLGSFSVSRGES